MKKYFITVKEEIIFLYVELKKSFSFENSFFSSKKLERGLFVLTALFAANYWFYTHVEKLSYEMVIAFCGMFLGFAGYSMATTQKEKRFNKKVKDDESEES